MPDIYKVNLCGEFQTLELVVLPVEVGGMDRDLVGQGECLRRALACLESHHGESLLKLTVAADKINEAPLCLCSKSLQSVVFRQKSLLLHPTTKIGLGNWIE